MRNLVLFFALFLLCSTHAFAVFVDSDNDGIPDDWEKNGVTVSFADGTTRFLDLAAQGASTGHRDVIVWICWLQNSDHSHKPLPRTETGPDGQHALEAQALDGVRAAFRRQGMNLIVFYSERPPIQETPALRLIGGADSTGNYDWTPLDNLIAPDLPVLPAGIRDAIHICTFIHGMAGPTYGRTGLAKSIPGREFLVSLARDDGNSADAVGNANEQEGTFMHELGHDLGLQHGGSDSTLYKPNYPSVMNYLFQSTGLYINGLPGNFDYSPKEINFDEQSVDGSQGVSSDPSLRNWGYGEVCDVVLQTYMYFPSLNSPNKWDCSGDPPLAGVSAIDVNKDTCIEFLSGFSDWTNLAVSLAQPGGGVRPVRIPRPDEEMLISQFLQIYAGLKVFGLTVTRQSSANLVSWSRVPLEAVAAYEVLRTAPGGQPVVIRRTSKSLFVDTSAIPGVNYTYQVRTVVSGFSEDAIRQVGTAISGVDVLPADKIKPAISLRRGISPALMLSQPSLAVHANQ